jgi:hypothetical protein
MYKPMNKWWMIFPVLLLLGVTGCATYNPRPMDEIPFLDRAQTQYKKNVQITAAVPSAEESKSLFGVDLYGRGVQPIWLKIENKDEKSVFLLPVGLDPNYFSPIEAAYVNHFTFSTPDNDNMTRHFLERGQGMYIAPGTTRSGFIYTPVDEGTKGFNVDIVGDDHEVRTFIFFINVPGLRVDHHQVDFETLYAEDEIKSYNADGLRKALENLPCCTTDKVGKDQGDPLNIVVIGEGIDILHALIRAGWDETETIYSTSVFKTARSFIFGGEYRYSPVSGLYVFDRPQDAGPCRRLGERSMNGIICGFGWHQCVLRISPSGLDRSAATSVFGLHGGPLRPIRSIRMWMKPGTFSFRIYGMPTDL